MHLTTAPKHHFEPRDPHWADKVRTSFARQGAMGLIGAELAGIESGKTLVITHGDADVVKNGKTTHCATKQQTLMTIYGKPEV